MFTHMQIQLYHGLNRHNAHITK